MELTHFEIVRIIKYILFTCGLFAVMVLISDVPTLLPGFFSGIIAFIVSEDDPARGLTHQLTFKISITNI